jgi:hypothetical protein
VARELQFDPARANPHGAGIALGHPIDATGAINTFRSAAIRVPDVNLWRAGFCGPALLRAGLQTLQNLPA